MAQCRAIGQSKQMARGGRLGEETERRIAEGKGEKERIGIWSGTADGPDFIMCPFRRAWRHGKLSYDCGDKRV